MSGASAVAQTAHAPSISVTTAAIRELVATIDVTGTLVPRDEVRIMAQVDGLAVTKIIADEGDQVKQGQLLAQLDDITLRAQLAQSNANLARAEAANVEAQKALLRTQALRKSGYATQAQLEQRISAARVAAAEEQAAKAQQTEFQTRLARTEIKAPSDGLIARRMAVVGMIASSSQPLYTMIARSEIELQAKVADSQHKLLSVNQSAKIFSAGDEKGLSGIVRLVSPQIDPATRLGDVRISLTEEHNFAVGSFARASIETARRTGLAVPLSAIAYEQDRASVMVVDAENRVHKREVKIGILAENYAEVADGLKEGEIVVARAGTFLRDNDVITPVKS